jgi:hypothetical protein
LPGTKYILYIYLAVAQRKNEKKTNHADKALFFREMTFIVREIAMTGQKLAPTMREKCSTFLFGMEETRTRSENSSDRKTTGLTRVL